MAKDLFASNDTSTPRAPRDLFENTSGEPESFLGKLLPNIGTGLTHAGRNLHNLPHDLVSGLENVTQSIGSAFDVLPGMPRKRQNISNYIPKDTTDYQNVFRNPGENTPTDYVVQKSFEYGPDVLMGLNALRGMKLLPHLTRGGASKKLRMAQEMANARDIGTLNVNPELIEDARQFLPDILRNRTSLSSSHAGDYNSLFKLQSELGQISGKRAKSWFNPESKIKGHAGLESRDNLLNALHENLQSLDHNDISKLLKEGQNDYRRYMKFKKYRNAISGAGLAYAVPKNQLTDLMTKIMLLRNQ
jgi:hypothetical protein